jgi:hypothetical protein
LRKEAVQKEAKEEEGARAREKAKEKEDRMGQFLDYQVKQLLQRLSDKAVMELPDDFYKLTAEEKLKLLLDAHLEYRKRGLGEAGEDTAKTTEESGRILGVSLDIALQEGIALMLNRRSGSWRSCRTSRVPWRNQRSIRSAFVMSARSLRVASMEDLVRSTDPYEQD